MVLRPFLLLLLVISVFSFGYDEEWEDWKKQHGKVYLSEEEEASRRGIWTANMKFIEGHNAHAKEFGYTLGMNYFGDLTDKEFVDFYLTSKTFEDLLLYEKKSLHAPSGLTLPVEVDWRNKGCVTPVKNQGKCGSCWAFSATGALEGQLALNTGKLVSLSEQNLVDCAWRTGNKGCNGGWPHAAFVYVRKNMGIDTEEGYPYVGKDQSCNYDPSSRGAVCSSYFSVRSANESHLQDAVARVGPISVAINASEKSLRFYKNGVYNPVSCANSLYNLNHAVLAVGYGTNSTIGQDYWIVKNSWGTSWGMQGYILMVRNKSNKCGIATAATYPIGVY